MGEISLVKSNNPKHYASLLFEDSLTQAKEVPDSIYLDIHTSEAHVSSIHVGTHAVVVRNSGRLSAKNVRLGHKFLSNYNIYPNVRYGIENLPSWLKIVLYILLFVGASTLIYFAIVSMVFIFGKFHCI